MTQRYTVVFEKDEDGWIVASAPILGVAAQGRTREVALRALASAVESYVLARKARGWAIPREAAPVVTSLRVAV
jgi:predicted RNase H-like HicB family nuclease